MDLKDPGSRRDSWMKKKKNVAGIFFGSLLRAFVVIGAFVIIALGVIIVKQVISDGGKKPSSGSSTSNYADGQRDELLTAEQKKQQADADEKKDDEKKKDDDKKAITGNINYNAPVVVLNGTQTPGLAGEWVNRLKDAGFTNVQPGNYFSETTGTKVYSSDGSGAALTELFKDAESVTGMIDQVETDMPLSDGQIVVVISKSDDVLSN